MPGGDRTGPLGMGPLSGRAAGYCAGYGMPGFVNSALGRGFGGGFGRGRGFGGRGYGGGGRGWRHWFHATGVPGWLRYGGWPASFQKPDPDLEKSALRSQAEALQAELDLIQTRLGEIESPAE
jgi:hypothetical protein